MMLAEGRRGRDEHEPQDHGGEDSTADRAEPRPRKPLATWTLIRRLLDPPADGLPHVYVAGQRRAEQRERTRHTVTKREPRDQAGAQQTRPVRMREHSRGPESQKAEHAAPAPRSAAIVTTLTTSTDTSRIAPTRRP